MSGLRAGIGFLLLAAVAAAQEIPPGTVLAVKLSSPLDAAKNKPGQQIGARLMQDVPLSSGAHIGAGARVLGTVVAVTPLTQSSGSAVSIRFDRLRSKRQDTPIITSLRAIASMQDVVHAQLPGRAPTRGETPFSWTTTQIGGDVVYRGGGPVMHGGEVVGVPVYGGVLAALRSNPGSPCPADDNSRRQALWVFSSDVCGAYGFEDLSIEPAGDTVPLGVIQLRSAGKVRVPAGSGLLLQVVAGN